MTDREAMAMIICVERLVISCGGLGIDTVTSTECFGRTVVQLRYSVEIDQ